MHSLSELNVVKTPHSLLISVIDGSMNFPGGTTILSILDTKSGFLEVDPDEKDHDIKS